MSEDTSEIPAEEPQKPTMDATMQARLLEAFPKSAIGHKPQRNNKTGQTFNIEFVGHAAVTKRLLEVDPYWTWRPLVTDDYGRPQFETDQQGHKVGFWIELTVGGVSRFGYGSVAGNAFEAEKQLIGDALRNAAMRFGVAVDLWHRGELASTLSESETSAPERAPMVHKDDRGQATAPAPAGSAPPRPPAPSGPPAQPSLNDAVADSVAAVGKLADSDMLALDTLDAIDQIAKSQPIEKMPTKLVVKLVLAKHSVMEQSGKWKSGALERNIGKYGAKHDVDLVSDLEQWDVANLIEFATSVLGIPKS